MTSIVGYHGTSANVAQQIIAGNLAFKPSENEDDWLGRGVYFFQDGPLRARTWARQRFAGTTEEPAVLAVDIDLAGCVDLIDSKFCLYLRKVHSDFTSFEKRLAVRSTQAGLVVQEGAVFTTESRESNPGKRPPIQNFRDRAFVNWVVEHLKARGNEVTSVRGLFLSGRAFCPESHLFDWAHVQISVVDRNAIKNPRMV